MAAKTGTYSLINSTTLGSAQSSVTFSPIPGTFTDLVLVIAGVTTSGTEAVGVQFNSDTGSNYSRTVLFGNGSTAASIRDSNSTNSALGVLDSATQGNTIYHFMDYANTTTFKTFIARGNVASEQTRAAVGLWRSTSAITSITVLVSTSFASGTNFKLYGIEAGNL
jgi:hypothetical protein